MTSNARCSQLPMEKLCLYKTRVGELSLEIEPRNILSLTLVFICIVTIHMKTRVIVYSETVIKP